MIRSLNGIAYRFLKNNKFVIASSIFSIMVSVCLIVSMFMFVSNAEKSMKDGIKELYGEMDITVGLKADSDAKFDVQNLKKISLLNQIPEDKKATMSEALLPVRIWIFHRMYCIWQDWASNRYLLSP